jgi:hypothetical protein
MTTDHFTDGDPLHPARTQRADEESVRPRREKRSTEVSS